MRNRWLFVVLSLFLANSVYSDTDSNSCLKGLADSDVALIKVTYGKIVNLKAPNLPTSLAMASLMQGKTPPYEIGCVALRFRINKDGKAEEIEVIKSIPNKIFDASAIQALQESQFSKEAGIGAQIFSFRME